MLGEVIDGVRELRPGDVVTTAFGDAGVVEPDAIRVVSDDKHVMRHRPALLLEMVAEPRVVRVAESMRSDSGDQRMAGCDLFADGLGVVGYQHVAVAVVLLGKLAEPRRRQVVFGAPLLDLPAQQRRDRGVSVVWVDDHGWVVLPVGGQHRQVRLFACVLALRPVPLGRLRGVRDLQQQVFGERHRRWQRLAERAQGTNRDGVYDGRAVQRRHHVQLVQVVASCNAGASTQGEARDQRQGEGPTPHATWWRRQWARNGDRSPVDIEADDRSAWKTRHGELRRRCQRGELMDVLARGEVAGSRECKTGKGDARHRSAGGASDHANIDPTVSRVARGRGGQWLWRMVDLQPLTLRSY